MWRKKSLFSHLDIICLSPPLFKVKYFSISLRSYTFKENYLSICGVSLYIFYVFFAPVFLTPFDIPSKTSSAMVWQVCTMHDFFSPWICSVVHACVRWWPCFARTRRPPSSGSRQTCNNVRASYIQYTSVHIVYSVVYRMYVCTYMRIIDQLVMTIGYICTGKIVYIFSV